jgi:outer membrane protein TolC
MTLLPSKERIYSERPDWQVALANTAQQEALAVRNARLMLPSLDGTLDYGTSRYPAYQSHFNEDWSGAVTLTIPLFQRLTLRSQARSSAFQAESAEHLLEDLRRKIEEEILTLPQEFEIARETALRREALLNTSRKLYADNLRRFKAGRSSTNELTVDLNRYLQTEFNAIDGWTEAHLAYTRLQHALGSSVLESEESTIN